MAKPKLEANQHVTHFAQRITASSTTTSRADHSASGTSTSASDFCSKTPQSLCASPEAVVPQVRGASWHLDTAWHLPHLGCLWNTFCTGHKLTGTRHDLQVWLGDFVHAGPASAEDAESTMPRIHGHADTPRYGAGSQCQGQSHSHSQH